ncbi:KH domain-containing protein [Candidatus Nomurabacteria bacterium]|nr:KH domain-containing protein [Candidatus Nomurabacteria bacterium]
MKALLEQIVKGIVNNPDAVSVEERESVDFPGLIILEVTVDDSDKGILIGRSGKTINAIRDLIKISAIRNQKRVKVLVKEDERPGKENRRREEKEEVTPKEVDQQTSEMNTQASEEVEDMLNDEV